MPGLRQSCIASRNSPINIPLDKIAHSLPQHTPAPRLAPAVIAAISGRGSISIAPQLWDSACLAPI